MVSVTRKLIKIYNTSMRDAPSQQLIIAPPTQQSSPPLTYNDNKDDTYIRKWTLHKMGMMKNETKSE